MPVLPSFRVVVLLSLPTLPWLSAQEVIWPEGRRVYQVTEDIPVSVVGVEAAKKATLEGTPANASAAQAVIWEISGDGATRSAKIPLGSLAPDTYRWKVNGVDAGEITIVSGVPSSTMFVAQSSMTSPKGGSNFHVGNAFNFGLLDANGAPLMAVRNRQSQGVAAMEKAMASGLPSICYMYWTGYITHKPWGSEKSWANVEMQEAMRQFNFLTAQRLRRFAPSILSIGAIDEPGLSWGRTPAGGIASGFPNWDEAPWYEKRGWTLTPDIAALNDEDWLRYVRLRCGILGESHEQAARDIKTVWPEAKISTDLYALHAVMDGTDALNQRANDIPASHVFFDFFGGPMSVPGGFYLEKCHDPTAKLAHAMNGQLAGERGPQRPLYHWLMNAMVQGGLHSNWWLNTTGMTETDLAAVNEPVSRWGPLFLNLSSEDHDVAILWGFSELAMRQKRIASLESVKKTGEQAKLLLPFLDEGEQKKTSISTNAYEDGATYTAPILGLHQTLRRAGYPAHILHEEIVTEALLARYRVLFIVGQNVPLPPATVAAIEQFIATGGIVSMDQSCRLKIAGAKILDCDFSADVIRGLELKAKEAEDSAAHPRDASYYQTNLYRDEFWRTQVPRVKKALAGTRARPVVISDSVDLSIERHVAGDGSVIMVLNGKESLPEKLPETASYPRYNPAAATHTYSLNAIPPGSKVWCVEGLDWRKVSEVKSPESPLSAEFEAGEMKLYVVAPKVPQGLKLEAKPDQGNLVVRANLQGLAMSWPLRVTVTSPDGGHRFKVQRAMDAVGQYQESFPLGKNAVAGRYSVQVESPIAGLRAEEAVEVTSPAAEPLAQVPPVQIVDQKPMTDFLRGKPKIVIAVSNSSQKEVAQFLQGALKEAGLAVETRDDSQVLSVRAYPRVLNPFVDVYTPDQTSRTPSGPVQREVTLDPASGDKLREPGTLYTVGKAGWFDWMSQDKETVYLPGVKIYRNAKGEAEVLNASARPVKADAAFRIKWCQPWTSLTSYNGGFQLPAQVPEAWGATDHLIVLGDSTSGRTVAALQASEILRQTVDQNYRGPGRAVVQFAWSPFAVEKNVIFVGASDAEGLMRGAKALAELVP